MKLLWPIAGNLPITQDSQAHLDRVDDAGNHPYREAVDFAAWPGTEWLSCAPKTAQVVKSGYDSEQGYHLWEQWHDPESDWLLRARYAHGSMEPPWGVGALVEPGEGVGWVGNSGNSTGPHLHFAVERWDGTAWVRLRPEDYLIPQPEPEEVIPMPTIEERMEAVEQELQRLHQFGLGTFGNLTLEDGGREPSNPVKLLLGRLGENLGLYGFFQRRFPGQAVGEYWAGLETSVPADLPANGYGGLPMRLWGQNLLLEANGALVVRTAVAERVYLSPPVYRDLRTGAFVSPASWSDAGEPLDAEGRLMGGIYYDAANLGTYLTVVDGRPVVVHQGAIHELT